MDRAWQWAPRVIGLAFALAYFWLCPPGFYWLDSAELSAAAVGLGSPHPTGFPLYCLLGKLASFLPVGELAFRLNLLSALCAALAVLGVARLVQSLGERDWPTLMGALAASCTLGVSFLFVRQATVAEVYAPTAAFLVAAALLFVRVARGADSHAGLSLAVVAGLGVGLHGSFRLLLVVPIAALLAVRLYRGARWPLLAPLLALTTAAGLHLYLPVRSASADPREVTAALDWGHPNTLQNLLAHANARDIRSAYGEEMLSAEPEVVRHNAWVFAEQVGDHLGVLCLLAALGGLLYLLRDRTRRFCAGLFAIMAGGDFIYGVWLNPMGLSDQQNGVPLAVAACTLSGLGVVWLARVAGRGAPFLGGAVAVVMVVPPALVTFDSLHEVGDLPRVYAEAALLDAPSRALVFAQSDSMAAGTLYLSTIEGMRPDVAALVAHRVGDLETSEAILARSGGEALAIDPRAPLSSVLSTGRTVVWEHGPMAAPETALAIASGVASHGAGARSSTVEDDLAAARASLARLFANRGSSDRVARRMHAHALTQLGRIALARGRQDAAAELLVEALKIRPRHAAAAVNLGSVLSRRGDFAGALELTEQVLKDEPNHEAALVNAGRYRLQLGDREWARAHCERALRVAPHYAEAWSLCGVMDAQEQRYDRARERLTRAVELAPGLPEATRALEQLRSQTERP